MSGNKDWFIELDESFKQVVRLGNNTRMVVASKGKIKLSVNGTTFIVSDVFYVPELKNNLLSLGQFHEKGLTVLFKSNSCRIYHPERVLLFESRMTANRMFKLLTPPTHEAKCIDDACLYTTDEDVSHLWHYRYGHLNMKGLKLLKNKEMVRGLPNLSDEKRVCTDCTRGRKYRETIPNKWQWRASTKLELIHVDVCGPISPASNSSKRYFLCLIDDFSRKAWVYLLAEKSEALHHFKCFKNMVEKESGMKIKCLKSDRGGEFLNRLCVITALL